MTNNSSKSRASYAAKLSSLTPPLLQNPAISPRDIYTSSSSAALFLSQVLKLPTTGPARVFVLGEAGIEEELAALGIPCLRPSSDTSPVPSAPDFAALSSPTALLPTISIVLSGLDFHPTYAKYALAHQYLLRPLPATATEGMPAEFLAMAAGKTLFLATNGDVTLPAAGTSFPGAGAMGAVLVASTGRVAVGMGKPGRRMMDAVLAGVALNSSAGGGGKGETLDRARCVMVGDRLDTDIVFGNESGLGGTLAVCTGVTDEEEILGVREGDPRRPGAWVETLGDLLLGLVGEGAEGGGEEGEMGGGDPGKVGG